MIVEATAAFVGLAVPARGRFFSPAEAWACGSVAQYDIVAPGRRGSSGRF
jgi:hypothetical protein